MFSMHSDMLGSYWGNNGTPYMLFRFFLIIFLMSIATYINRFNEEFLSRFVPRSMLIITAIVIIDYYITNFSGSQFLYRVWWIAYIIVTQMTVFITSTIFIKDGYNELYMRLWRAFTAMYVFVIIICFIRRPGESFVLNTELGKGNILMLKTFITNVHASFEYPLMFFGNIAIFTPLPFILSAISKKCTPPIILIAGFITPFVVEGYQLIFKCGEVDIDDIVLNFSGFLLSFIVYLILYKHKLKQKDTAD